MLLRLLPGSSISQYSDSNMSTFGEPNITSAGIQDLGALRPDIVIPGNVNCDDRVSLADALIIAQYTVGVRTDSGGCPLTDVANQIHLEGGDINGDNRVSLADALPIAQCQAGITNVFCP